MTAAQKAESEQEDHTGEDIHVRSICAEGKDDIVRLSEQIAQLLEAVKMPKNTAVSNPWQLGSEKHGNGKKVKLRVKEKVKPMVREVTTRGYNVFNVRGEGT